MPVNLSGETKEFSIIGKVWEFILRLLKVLTPEQLANGFQQVINDPIQRQTVADALMGRIAATVEVTQDRWIEREINVMNVLGIEGGEAAIRELARVGHFGWHKYFIPSGLSRAQLLELASYVGIKLYSSPNCDGVEILTKAGVLECELDKIMTPTDSNHRPFNLDYEEHLAWAKEQGGDDHLTSAEEMLYLLIRAYLQFGKIPFMGGWIRCRNRRGSDSSLGVRCGAGGGLDVGWFGLDYRYWDCGAVPRKFTPLS